MPVGQDREDVVLTSAAEHKMILVFLIDAVG